MPRSAKGPRLWLRPARNDGEGHHVAVWIIKDAGHHQSTGCVATDIAGAERALEQYLNAKHTVGAAKAGSRDPAAIPIADVLNFYAEHVAPKHARPKETLQRIGRLAVFFNGYMLAQLDGELCRAFTRARGKTPAAREDLIVLRSAINFHREEGKCDRIVSVALPEKRPGRERWLTRSEAAALIWRAWRYREVQKGHPTGRYSRRHVARFILVGLYTGTRASAICSAAFEPFEGHGYIDVERGIFYRRPAGAAETKKRRPPVPLPARLLAHVRRWQRLRQRFCVEWNGAAVHDVDKAFRRNAHDCGMKDVTPHTLRHTAATWLMQGSADIWQSAKFLGMTVEQLERTYGHHHPDHLKGARDTLGRRPGAGREQKASATGRPPIPRNGT
jgi:integrase